ncbi:MAG: hypothetical protein LT106_13775 [Burkholderiaceae bacterium]|nr:hypothetical protein [Burkholderiaceae bacterium]
MPRKPNRWSALVACLGGACLALLAAASPATAADTGSADSIRQQYQADRAACLSGRTGEDLKDCLREAGAAAQAARQGKLLEGPGENFRQNALARCAPLPPEQREACRMRIEGAGTVTGSVEGGGLYRELIVREPASSSSSPAPATMSPPAASATPSAPTPPAAPATSPATTVVPSSPGTPSVVVPGTPSAASPPAVSSTTPAAPVGPAPGAPTFTPVQPVVPGRAVPAAPSTANEPAASSLQISPPSTPVMQAPPPPTFAPQPALVAPGSVPPRGAQ